MKRFKRGLAILLSACRISGMMPLPVSAEEVTAQLDVIDEAKAELSDEELAQLDLTRYDATVAKMMAPMGMDGAGEAMLVANVATPKYFSWDADKTLDVSKVSAEEINPQVYTMNTKDAVYTITGKNSNHTALQFVISEDCTVILDNTAFTAGLSYKEGEFDYGKRKFNNHFCLKHSDVFSAC